jgi:hypothetical protein
VLCYTFASPSVGDQLFADALFAGVRQSVRVYMPLDIVVKSLSAQFPHVRGAYPVSPIPGAIDHHDLGVYQRAVAQPRALGIVGIALPLVYIALALAAAYSGKLVATAVRTRRR